MEQFFYSKYSNYDQEQICDNFFKKTARDLEERNMDKKTAGLLQKILYEGGFDDFTVNTNRTNKDNPRLEAQRRKCFASLLLSDPKTFDLIVKNNILLFHGSNSNALADILQNGLNSESNIIENGRKITTGEFSPAKPREFISFTNQMDLALQYATLQPTFQANDEKSYGVIFGISIDDINNHSEDIRTARVGSDTPEIGILKHLPREYIKMIAVPQKHIEEVLSMIEKYGVKGINIVPAEGIVEAVLEADKYRYGTEWLNPDCLEINGKSNYSKKFGKDDFKKVAETKERKTSKIKQVFDRLKSELMKIKGDKDEYARD